MTALRKTQNVWRIYTDLLTNFLAVFMVGGAGLMIMVGGAIIHRFPGVAAHQPACNGKTFVDAGELAMARTSQSRDAKFRDSDCTYEARYEDITFVVNRDELTARESEVKPQICNDIYDAVNFIVRHKLDGAHVELVGRTSGEFNGTGNCGSDDGAEQVVSKYCSHCTVTDRAGFLAYLREGSAHAPRAADRYLCNAPLAARRAVWAQRMCLNWASGLGQPKPANPPKVAEMLPLVTLASEPDVDAAPFKCPPTNEFCARTVSVRVRLPVQTSGVARPDRASAPAVGGNEPRSAALAPTRS